MKLFKVPVLLFVLSLFAIFNSSCDETPIDDHCDVSNDSDCAVDVQCKPSEARYYEIAVVMSEELSGWGDIAAQQAMVANKFVEVNSLLTQYFDLRVKIVAIVSSDIPSGGDWHDKAEDAREMLWQEYDDCFDFDACYFMGPASGSGGESQHNYGSCGGFAGSRANSATIIHELGHLLGASHPAAADCSCHRYIMCGAGEDPGFSHSAQYLIKKFIDPEDGSGSCLDNEPNQPWVQFESNVASYAFPSISKSNNGTDCSDESVTLSVPGTYQATNWEFNESVSIINQTGNSVVVSLNGHSNFIARASVLTDGGCDPLTVENSISVSTIEGPCFMPTTPPIELDFICQSDDEVCVDFSNRPCVTSFTVESNYNKLLASTVGSSICLTVLHHAAYSGAQVTVTPTVACGTAEPVVWDIGINGEQCSN